MLYEALIEEILQKLPCYEKLCVYKLHELLTVLERSLIHDTHPPGDYFDKIAARLGYTSPAYFFDAFKKKTGLSPSQYRRRI